MIGARSIFALIPVGLLLAACLSVPKDGEFHDVAAAVEKRLQKQARWIQSKEDADAAKAAVAELLSKDLTEDSGVQIVLLNNRSLQATYFDLGIAQAALVQAGLLRNPIFDVALGFPEEGTSVNLGVGMVFEFLDVLTVQLRQRVAESEFEATKLTVIGKVIDVATATRVTFRELQARQQILSLFRQVEASSVASLEAARTLHRAGNIPALDLANERFLAAQASLGLAEAEARVLEARERLNVLMGVWGTDTTWRVTKRLPTIARTALDLDRAESAAVANSLDLAIARQNLTTLGRRHGVTKVTSLIPELELGAEAERDEREWSIGPATSLIPELELGAEAERDEREWSIGPAIALPIPIFDQGQARRASARSAIVKAQERYADLAIRIRSAARIERSRLLKARRTVEYYRKHILPLTAQILDRTLREYNAMQIGVFRLLDAKEQQIVAGQRYIEALRDYWISRARVEQLLNGRLPTETGDSAAVTAGSPGQPDKGGH